MPAEVATGIAKWLSQSQFSPGNRIRDPIHQMHGSYADGFAALTFALLGWEEPMEKALQVSLARDSSSEFDSLAQALLSHLLAERIGPGWSEKIRSQPLYDGPQLVSKNWAIFRGLTRALLAPGSEDLSLAESQLPSGLFPDSPFGQATPTCYHAKICAVLALYQRLTGSTRYQSRLQAGLKALVCLISPSGVISPYGRSRNTLFAYGSAYLALRLGSSLFADGQFSWGAARVLSWMQSYQRKDGHIPASLNDQEWIREDWDVYINNPDYNAYSAACLLLARHLVPQMPEPLEPPPGATDLGVILSLRQPGQYFACSLQGEFEPIGSPFFCDTRYAGLSPLIYDDGLKPRFFERNYCWDGRDRTRGCLVDPRLSPWVPYLRLKEGFYWVRRYSKIEWSLQSSVLSLEGTGNPLHSRPTRAWERWVETRLRKGPGIQMQTRQLPSPLTARLQVDFDCKKIQMASSCPQQAGALQRQFLEDKL